MLTRRQRNLLHVSYRALNHSFYRFQPPNHDQHRGFTSQHETQKRGSPVQVPNIKIGQTHDFHPKSHDQHQGFTSQHDKYKRDSTVRVPKIKTERTKDRANKTSSARNVTKRKSHVPIEPLVIDTSAFRSWDLWHLFRNWTMFMLCQFNLLVDFAPKIMPICSKTPVVKQILKKTAYDQFVGGETDEEIQKTVEELRTGGLDPMIALPVEIESLKKGQSRTDWQLENQAKMIECVRKARQHKGDHKPVMHLKITGVVNEELFLKLTDIIGYDITTSETFEPLCDLTASLMCQEPLPENSILHKYFNAEEIEHYLTVMQRLRELGQECLIQDVQCAVDAEYVNLNPAISLFTMAMAKVYNREEKPYIWNTYQCYLKNAPKVIDFEVDYLQKHGKSWGAKIVRGAYMVTERNRAVAGGYDNPVCDTIEDTHINYNSSMSKLIEKIINNQKIEILVASHNEETIEQAFKQIKTAEQSGTSLNQKIVFGQLYGMCDHISGSLANAGLPVYKSLPIGGLQDTMPYLCRRAVENKTILQGAHRERALIADAIVERGKNTLRVLKKAINPK